MAENKAPPQIFDTKLLARRRVRAAARVKKHGASFIMQRCARDAAERLCDINRQFENALIVGPEDFLQAFLAALPDDKTPMTLIRQDDMPVFGDAEPHKVEPDKYDLIISALVLHKVNDLPGALIRSNLYLKPDGLFLGAMFGGHTLSELRRAAYQADEQILGGMTARIYPFADYSQAAALMQRSGFALPVIDMDRFTVSYSSLNRLVADIRDMGDSNSLLSRDGRYVSRFYWGKLLEAYAPSACENGKRPATFEIIWMTGWSPHKSQQKPLKPGSAKMRLADALKSQEHKL